jgi:hypothetical protein
MAEAPGSDSQTNEQRSLFIYERAQENAHHHETVMWTFTSVAWAANAVLLEIALNLKSGAEKPWPLFAVSLIGLILTAFVWHMWGIFRNMKNSSYKTCQDIEGKFPDIPQVHNGIAKVYSGGEGTYWVQSINTAFGLVWFVEILTAFGYFQRNGP